MSLVDRLAGLEHRVGDAFSHYAGSVKSGAESAFYSLLPVVSSSPLYGRLEGMVSASESPTPTAGPGVPVPTDAGGATIIIMTTILISLAAVVGFLLFRRRTTGYDSSYYIAAEMERLKRETERLTLNAKLAHMASDVNFAPLFHFDESWGKEKLPEDVSHLPGAPHLFAYEGHVKRHEELHGKYAVKAAQAVAFYNAALERYNAAHKGFFKPLVGLVTGRVRKADRIFRDAKFELVGLVDAYGRDERSVHGDMLDELPYVKRVAGEMKWNSNPDTPQTEYALMSHLDHSTPLPKKS